MAKGKKGNGDGGQAPGRSHREGVSVIELGRMFDTEEKAIDWFEQWRWPDRQPVCLKCGSVNAYRVKSGKPMPYRCRDCKDYFSLKTNTPMQDSKLPLRLWAWAIYLEMTSLKGVSSMKLHRDLKVRQATAWYMLHRIREAFMDVAYQFEGPVEVDEAYFGGLEKNKHAKKKQRAGRGPVGKTPVAGMRDRKTKRVAAKVLDDTTHASLREFVDTHRKPGVKTYTDESRAYDGMENRESVKHSVGEYVRGMAHTNGVESFWSTLKRAHKGVYHQFSPRHLQRYVSQFAGRHNVRDMDTLEQMQHVLAGMVGRKLLYRDLVGRTECELLTATGTRETN
ncbi:IS1595 family transposase [Candidatus Palauibacter sp.]|uniref:IS1595 family transposase n=1 Tax=Candidatus Palauibacter sp. TaxID=3101350 RepID=UPI003B5A2BAD